MTTPSSAALMLVPSGTARLMPSLRSPSGFLPKPEITRPRTGQRKPDGAALTGAAAAWVAALPAGAIATSCGAAAGAGPAVGSAGGGVNTTGTGAPGAACGAAAG